MRPWSLTNNFMSPLRLYRRPWRPVTGPGAVNIYETRTLPALGLVAQSFSQGIEAERTLMARQEEALKIYHGQTQPALEETRGALDKVKAMAVESLAGLKKACTIYSTQTLPALAGVQGDLKTIREEAQAP